VEVTWLILAYSLPPEPSRKRVAVWRRMRKLGAVYLNEGIWFLPNTAHLSAAMDEVLDEVRSEGGTGWGFRAEALRPEEREELKSRFNGAREEEYSEISRQCDRFLAHINRETEGGHFAFTTVEELEQDLEKRKRWLVQVSQRDILGAAGRDRTEVQLQECRQALDAFAEAAFVHASNGTSNKQQEPSNKD
jgi:ChrB-like protein